MREREREVQKDAQFMCYLGSLIFATCHLLSITYLVDTHMHTYAIRVLIPSNCGVHNVQVCEVSFFPLQMEAVLCYVEREREREREICASAWAERTFHCHTQTVILCM